MTRARAATSSTALIPPSALPAKAFPGHLMPGGPRQTTRIASRFTAKRFAGHFMPWGSKHIDEIDFRLVKEDNTRVLGMIKGDYQGTGGYLPNDQVKRLREAPNATILEAEPMRITMF